MNKITKIEVSKGIYWVEVPDAKLYILCGCPADSVKHLMKRGLITSVEKNGVTFESGPNAILLSDVMLQNGHFANLGEFPVLQMLYRQGMIIPNHPNNTGIKPLIIGSTEQINAQMQYIYRGNYGLVSEEEIINTQTSPEDARDQMLMKLKFAFGKIRKTEELIDSLVIGREPVEIRDGVSIQRLDLNVFQFNYLDASVTVDLNLPLNMKYMSPYPLGFYDINRDYFGIIHSGQGDGWDVNRPSVSSVLMFQGKIYLIDAGPNLSYALTSLGIGVNEIEGVFQTHAHDDHFAGLTTLILSDRPVKLYATPLVRASVFKKLAALMSIENDDFSSYFESHDLKFDVWNDIGGLEVKPFLSPHPVETSVFTFRTFWEGGYISYAHLADIVSLDILKGMIRKSDQDHGVSQEYYDQAGNVYLERADVKKVDIGGGMIHGDAEDFAKDASERIILCHSALRLTSRQKMIGSSAPFGIEDTLIPDCSDSLRMIARDYMEAFFPDVPNTRHKILLNNRIITFKPGSIILKEGVVNEEIYLLLTGVVEAFCSKESLYNILSSGEIIGEYTGIHGFPSKATYRSVSFVKALRLPYKVYLQFIKQNKLFTKIERVHENREFLQKTWLFGESIAYPTQNKIARAMKLHFYYNPMEELSNLNSSSLYMVQSGKLEKTCDENCQILNQRDFFGEETAIFKSLKVFHFKTLEPSGIYEIPCEVFSDIPVVTWKLLEIYRKWI